MQTSARRSAALHQHRHTHRRYRSGAVAALVAVARRADGTSQVTYARHPLYYYVADRQPGQSTGQGLNQFGATWFVLSAQGAKVDKGGS